MENFAQRRPTGLQLLANSWHFWKSKLSKKRGPTQIAFDQENFLHMPVCKCDRQVCRDQAFAFFRHAARDQHLLNIACLSQLPQADREEAKFFCSEPIFFGEPD